MKLECIYEIIDFPKYHWKNLIDFSPESSFRLGILNTHLSRVAFKKITCVDSQLAETNNRVIRELNAL